MGVRRDMSSRLRMGVRILGPKGGGKGEGKTVVVSRCVCMGVRRDMSSRLRIGVRILGPEGGERGWCNRVGGW